MICNIEKLYEFKFFIPDLKKWLPALVFSYISKYYM